MHGGALLCSRSLAATCFLHGVMEQLEHLGASAPFLLGLRDIDDKLIECVPPLLRNAARTGSLESIGAFLRVPALGLVVRHGRRDKGTSTNPRAVLRDKATGTKQRKGARILALECRALVRVSRVRPPGPPTRISCQRPPTPSRTRPPGPPTRLLCQRRLTPPRGLFTR